MRGCIVKLKNKKYKPRCHAKRKTPVITRFKKPKNEVDAFKIMFYKTEDIWLNYIEEVFYEGKLDRISCDSNSFYHLVNRLDDLKLISDVTRILKKYHPDFNPYEDSLEDYLDELPYSIKEKLQKAII